MKNNFEKLIKKAGAHTALTGAERGDMRSLLSEYAAMKPVRESIAPPAGAGVTFIDAWLAYLRRPAGIAVAAALMLILSSGGVAYAAEGTLPGNVLYPIKINVVEPLQLALAASPESKAALQMTFAESRINEAATLANEGNLGTATEAALAANFTENADGAARAVAQERAHNPTTADLLSTGFAARLAAYESVLATVGVHARSEGATAHFQAVIQTQIASIAIAQANGDASSTSSNSPSAQGQSNTTEQNVLHLQNAADAALRVSAGIIDMTSGALDASSSASAQNQFARASTLAEQGRVLLKQHDESGAVRAFQDSLSAAARLDVLTRAAAALKIQTFATTTVSTTTVSSSGESSTNTGNVLPLPHVVPAAKEGSSPPLGL